MHRILALGLMALVVGVPTALADLINGGFENPIDPHSVPGWNIFDPDPSPATTSTGFPFVHSGEAAIWGGAYNAEHTPGRVWQENFTSEAGLIPLSFWLANIDDQWGVTEPDNYFEVLWNGISVFSSVNLSPQPYTPYTIYVNSSALNTVEFRLYDAPGALLLDDVSVPGAATGVPEPSTLVALLIGVAALLARKAIIVRKVPR